MHANRIFRLIVCSLSQLVLFLPLLCADPTTVTNTGNVTVSVQYKTADSDYQDQNLKPGESKELPGGVEKVKLSREQPGEWASPQKPGQEIQVTVKEGTKTVGKMNGFGDKLIFDQPTTAPPTTAVQVNSQSPQKSEEPTKQEPVKEPTQKSGHAKEEKLSEKPPTGPGKVENDGYSTVVVTVKKADGTTTKPVALRSHNSIDLPEDAVGVTLNQPMMDSGIRFPDQKPIDVKIKHPDGSTDTIEDVPPSFEKPMEVNVKRPYGDLKIDYFQDSRYKPDFFKNNLRYNYGKDSINESSDNSPNSRSMGAEQAPKDSGLQNQYKYQF